jgi:hypothetical protein
LATDLRNAGANVWLDQIDIAPGSRWDESVQAALNEANGMIVILSPASVESQNVMDEVSYAMSQGKSIVPLMKENCAIPFRLARLQYIDFTRNYDAAFPRLLKALTKDQTAPVVGPSAKKRKYLKPVAIVFAAILVAALLIIFIRLINNKPTNGTVHTVSDAVVTVDADANAIVLSDKTPGGQGGIPFNDLDSISDDANITGIVINHGDLIDDIRFMWDAITSPIHGEAPKGGEPTKVFFSNGEYVKSISGYLGRDPYVASDVICSVTIYTNKRTLDLTG